VTRIYLSPPHLGTHERDLLIEALDSGWIAPLGPQLDAFEAEFAASIEADHAVGVVSGTAALHLALLVLGVGAGDDVLVPTMTFAATANAVTYVGARPCFIDSEPSSWNVDPELLDLELSERAARDALPKAAIIVDLYGQCADYNRIVPLFHKYGIPIIEDAAEALGAKYDDRPAGSFGAISIFSFNGNKIITTSGGGMLVSPNREWVERARYLATQARDPAPHYQHSQIGYNYRLSNLLAAVGRGQLLRLPERVEARRATNRFYRQALAGVSGIQFMPEIDGGRSTFWLTCILIDEQETGVTPDDIRQHLESLDIESRPVWKPMHLQPVFHGNPMREGAVAEDLFKRGLCLPSGSSLSEPDKERIVAELVALLSEQRTVSDRRIPGGTLPTAGSGTGKDR